METNSDDIEQPKHPGGRPLKFASAQILQQKIEAFFGDCDPHLDKRLVRRTKQDNSVYWTEEEVMTDQLPYTISGLALALDTSRDVIDDYGSGKYDSTDPEYSNTVKRAKLKIESQWEANLGNGQPATGSIFWLKNRAGWVDKSVQEHEGGFFDQGGRLQVEIINPGPIDGEDTKTEPDPESGASATS